MGSRPPAAQVDARALCRFRPDSPEDTIDTKGDTDMAEERSTVRTRELGYALRSAMEQAGLSGKQTATLLDWSESRVSRFLN